MNKRIYCTCTLKGVSEWVTEKNRNRSNCLYTLRILWLKTNCNRNLISSGCVEIRSLQLHRSDERKTTAKSNLMNLSERILAYILFFYINNNFTASSPWNFFFNACILNIFFGLKGWRDFENLIYIFIIIHRFRNIFRFYQNTEKNKSIYFLFSLVCRMWF